MATGKAGAQGRPAVNGVTCPGELPHNRQVDTDAFVRDGFVAAI
jgi:hypothetical protein